ncbi:MAG: hypothetical protein ACJ0DD_04220 [Paracoccaceae bacterium]
MNKFISVIIIFAFLIGSPIFSNPKGKGLWCTNSQNLKSENNSIPSEDDIIFDFIYQSLTGVGANFSSENFLRFYWIEFANDLYKIETVGEKKYYDTKINSISWRIYTDLKNEFEKYGVTERNTKVTVDRKTLKLSIHTKPILKFQCEVAQDFDALMLKAKRLRDLLQEEYNKKLEGNKI